MNTNFTMVILILLLAFIPEYPAILFGGCGCPQICPPPPPPCPQLPCLPPPPCPQLPCLPPPPPPCPCLPPIELPCPPQPCNCGCGRKKRSPPLTALTSENGTSKTLCNNKQIRKIILKNLSSDPKISKAAIYSELKAKQPGDYVVLCSQSYFPYTADSINYCVDGNANQTCYVFQI